MKNISVFASGSGTNAENIMFFFINDANFRINAVFSDNANAFVLERANKFGIKSFIFTNQELKNTDIVLNLLKTEKTDFIILAGFLKLIPKNILQAFPGRIINIHPALLPKYGGKGMYGDNIHKAVKNAGETETGITIHLVNEKYDDGKIIFQAKCKIKPDYDYKKIAKKIHTLEYEHYPKIIKKTFLDFLKK